jgi:hypothetical protein
MEHLFALVLLFVGERLVGTMNFRLVLQPMVAALFAIRAGISDARENRPPYVWALLTDPVGRYGLLREGWRSIGRVFVFAIILDIAYQWIEYGWVYIAETLVIASILAILPYLLLRGPANRVWRSHLFRERETFLAKRRMTQWHPRVK